MNTVAIVGVGLIGGSFGLALRENGFTGDLIGVSSQPAIEAGLHAGAITRSANLDEAAARSRPHLSRPARRSNPDHHRAARIPCPARNRRHGRRKYQTGHCAKSGVLPFAVHFIGGHPLTGKEQRGVAAAQFDLFRDRPYILTPHLPETPSATNLRSWLQRIGARIVEMTPSEHDSTVALTSHLPQMLSTALAVTLARQQDKRVFQVFGPGLIDMTRLAMSAPDLWKSILSTNKPAVLAALTAYSEVLKNLQLALESDRLVELFEIGSGWAKELRQSNAGT